MSALSTDLPKIAHYQAISIVHESDRTLVYRSVDEENGQSVAIKLMGNAYPSFGELVRFRNQYAIAKNLESEGIIKTYALERYKNRYALIMEDMGGVSLDEYASDRSLSLAQFLPWACQLAEILHDLHQNNIIHKDIKPANILICPETQQIKLIDFSISSLLPKETQSLQTPNVLEGTLAYLSPEQTGRMNRGIDYRSDFYSLGVTFYELLAGHVPFTHDDPLELIHAHIAKHPTPLTALTSLDASSHQIPQVLSDIVLKLMAKNAEDRYQSALGLKHDLEKCLWHYRETGTIAPFELGERDLCDRFNIPEKLYGRDKEVQTLLNAFDRVASPEKHGIEKGHTELMLVAGFSGIGKTAAIDEVHKPITRQKGYFIQGKFDQFNRNIPFSAFVQAFRNLMGQLLGESDTALAAWKSKILTVLGDNGRVITDTIPELENIIGAQPPVPELSGSAAQNRFNLLFGKFLQVFASQEHPLVIFLDDLQWADSASLNLLKLLMEQSETGYLLILGAYRDNEVSPTHPLLLTLDDIEKQGGKVQTLTLNPLSESDINRLVADTLLCEPTAALPFSQLTYQKTRGNPFFTTQFLQGLHQEGCITFNAALGYWECDLTRVRQLALTDNVVEFMVGRLRKLSEATQEVLKFAACIGNRFDLATLAVVCEDSQEAVAADLWEALREGFILPESQTYKFFQGERNEEQGTDNIAVDYRFLHDRIQQAAYWLIPDDRKNAVHFTIGQLLLKNLSPQEREEQIFAVVNQLNFGIPSIDSQIEKNKLANLNAIAGQKAKASTAYHAAVKYFAIARELMGEEGWRSHYQFMLTLYEASAEAAYLNTDFAQTEQLSSVALQQTQTLLDRVNIYAIQIQSNIARVQLLEAVNVARNVLGLIDGEIDLPAEPNMADFQRILAETQGNLANRSISELLCLPEMEDPTQLAIVRILASAAPPAYFAFPQLLPLIAMRMVNLSIAFGNTSSSAFGYSMYGFILCGMTDDIQSGYQFGQLALDLVEKFNSKEIKAKVLVLAGAFINHWRDSVEESLALLPKAYQAGLEAGDVEFAAYAASFYCFGSMFAGRELTDLERELAAYGDEIARLKQEHVLDQIYLSLQAILNLSGRSEHPCHLVGEVYDETKAIPLHEQANNRTTLAFLYTTKLSLCYLFEDYDSAAANAVRAEEYLDGVVAMLCVALFNFYDSLVQVARFRDLPAAEQQQCLDRIEQNQAKMKYWADNAPMNYLHKFHLVEAERNRILDRKIEAMEHYELAIELGRQNEYVQDEALANELAAKFYLDWDFGSAQSKSKEKYAALHMQDAYYGYARWGAKTKTDDLEQRYPQLLKPILERKKISLKGETNGATLSKGTISHTNTEIGEALDFASFMKAARTLSEEIDLDRLISTLMNIILENAGATKGALLFIGETGLTVEAIATRTDLENNVILESNKAIALDNYPDLPAGLINYVRNTTETALLDAKTARTQFSTDRYLLRFSPQSLLCFPLLERGNLIGILYLENTVTADAFTTERVDLLDALCAQAAISLTNARLYQQAQQALTDLQQAQLQLVQNEKMATLGNLVAGVAHEINNPVGFIGGNISAARDYLQDLSMGLALYQEHTSPPEEIAEELEDLDLDFVLEDFPKLIASMETGCDRIANISTSLRAFSRTDADKKTEFNLHEGIDSTLLILKYRLKANDRRPAIEIVKHYGQIPEVTCYAGQINQVFMNLLANAIDALDESNEGKSFDEIENEPNRITIATELSEDKKSAIVRISDNGTGIPEDVKEKIFDQGFTTKEVGKGTGLGMAIAQSIVEEKHGGAIACHSELGKGTEFIIFLPISHIVH